MKTPKKRGGGGVRTPFVTFDELPNFSNKPSVVLRFPMSGAEFFKEYFSICGIDTIVIADTGYMENYYNFYVQNLDKLYTVYEMLADEESKEVFLASIKGNLTNRTSDFRFAPEPQYFLEGFLPVEGDIAIDGGAFDGATSRDFTIQGAKVYAFEMDAKNYQNCLELAEKYNFTIENLGLSNQEGEEFYAQGGAGSSKGRGNLIAKFTDLDTYVLKNGIPHVDYIKLDIEGAELDMLHGAAKTISRWKPKMAVSAYHKSEDLWTLATYIKSIRPDYEFQFRHYKVNATEYNLSNRYRNLLKKFHSSYFVGDNREKVLYCR